MCGIEAILMPLYSYRSSLRGGGGGLFQRPPQVRAVGRDDGFVRVTVHKLEECVCLFDLDRPIRQLDPVSLRRRPQVTESVIRSAVYVPFGYWSRRDRLLHI